MNMAGARGRNIAQYILGIASSLNAGVFNPECRRWVVTDIEPGETEAARAQHDNGLEKYLSR